MDQRCIADKIFLKGFKYLFPFYIITGYTINDICSFQCIQVIIDCIKIDFTLLAFEIICNILCRKLISDIVKYIPYNPFQKLNIPDIISPDNITKDDRRIDIEHHPAGTLLIIVCNLKDSKSTGSQKSFTLLPQVTGLFTRAALPD